MFALLCFAESDNYQRAQPAPNGDAVELEDPPADCQVQSSQATESCARRIFCNILQ